MKPLENQLIGTKNQNTVHFVEFDKEGLYFKVNLDLFTTFELKTVQKFTLSLKPKYSAYRILNDWVQFDLDLMRFNTKDLDCN